MRCDVLAPAILVFASVCGGLAAQCPPAVVEGAKTGATGFGSAVALSRDGRTAVAGAPGEDGSRGAVYVFVRRGTGWNRVARLRTRSRTRGRFGVAVAIAGRTIVAGAPDDRHPLAARAPGSAYVFEEPAGGWADMTETWRLVPSAYAGGRSGKEASHAGNAVAISGGTIAVGAARFAEERDVPRTGRVFVFERIGASWGRRHRDPRFAKDPRIREETGFLVPPGSKRGRDPAASDFGRSVAASAGTIVAGATDRRAQRGRVHVFDRRGSGWQRTAVLRGASRTRSDFGAAVAIDGNVVAAGDAGFQGQDARGRLSGRGDGAAYVFLRTAAATWEERGRIVGRFRSGDALGSAVAVAGDRVLAGASGAGGRGQSGPGRVLVLRPGTAGRWIPARKPLAAGTRERIGLGSALSLAGDTALAGAPRRFRRGARAGRTAGYVFDLSRSCACANAPCGCAETELATRTLRAAGDGFGWDIAVSGHRVLAGAPGRDHDRGPDAGAAYVLEERIDPKLGRRVWAQAAELVVPDPRAEEDFGYTVSLEEDTAFVAAPFDSRETFCAGAVYAFERQGTDWSARVQRLVPETVVASDEFGIAIAQHGSEVLIAAHGAAYVFARRATGWVQVAKLVLPGRRPVGAVAFSGDCALLGSPDTCVAVFYARPARGWGSAAPSFQRHDGPRGSGWGTAVALSGSTAMVAAPLTAVRGKQRAGEVAVFARDARGRWRSLPPSLRAVDAAASAGFGSTLARDGDRAVIGTDFTKRVYAYQRRHGTWVLAGKLRAAGVGLGPVATDGRRVVASAPPIATGRAWVFDLDCAALYGSGINPPGSLTLLGGPPLLGSTFRIGADNPLGTQRPGPRTAAFLFLSSGRRSIPVAGAGQRRKHDPPLADWTGELLIDPGRLVGFRAPWTGPGRPATFSLPIPDAAALLGIEVLAQGILIDLGGNTKDSRMLGLTEALSFRIGPAAQ